MDKPFRRVLCGPRDPYQRSRLLTLTCRVYLDQEGKLVGSPSRAELELVLVEMLDLDFALTVLEDGCADMDPEVHRVLVEKVYPRQAKVTTVSEWVHSLGG